MIAAEAWPFASSGGLAEVVGALPEALARLGHTVTTIIPRYPRVRLPDADASPAHTPDSARLTFGSRTVEVRFEARTLSDRTRAVFVDIPELFDRETLYGPPEGDYEDNWLRFAAFSRAALEYVRLRNVRPSVIHTHDWHTGLVPAYQKMLFSPDPVVGGVPAVFTIHNTAFQGVFPAAILPEIGLPWEVMDVRAMEYWGQVSFLKAGINFSERITTVSPGYAREILQPELGFGMHGVLERRAGDLTGILNGIDTSRWDPAGDPHLPAHYDATDLSGKRACKQALLQAAGLPASAAALPAIGLVSRFTGQKGFDLLADTAEALASLDAVWIVLGSGERRYEEFWRDMAARHPDRISVTIGYDERLDHLIQAGADVFLMPSRFEPCGLNQLNSLRYGTLPVVRATGGLDDTVVDAAEEGGTGFKFRDYSGDALLDGLRRALDHYRRPEHWAEMQRRAMRQDHSWDASAREYVKVYRAHS